MGSFSGLGQTFAAALPFIDSDTDRELAAQESLRASEQPIIDESVDPSGSQVYPARGQQDVPGFGIVDMDTGESSGSPAMAVPQEPVDTPTEAPRTAMSRPQAGIVPEPAQPVKVPGPTQAIEPPKQRPAESIKEYIQMMREQNKTPFFTNIQGHPGIPGNASGVVNDPQHQRPGAKEIGEPFQLPQEPGMDVRYNQNVPGGVVAKGTMNAGNIMKGSEGGYDPSGDPFQGATDLAMRDAPQLWDMITGGNVPMDQATPEQYKKMSAMLMQARDHYLEATGKRREDYIKLVASGVPASEAQAVLQGGQSAAMLKTSNKLQSADREHGLAFIQKDVQGQRENYTNAVKNLPYGSPPPPPFDENAAMKKAVSNYTAALEALNIMQRQSSGEGAVPEQGQKQATAGDEKQAVFQANFQKLSDNEKTKMKVMLQGAARLKEKFAPELSDLVKKGMDTATAQKQIDDKIRKMLEPQHAWALKTSQGW